MVGLLTTPQLHYIVRATNDPEEAGDASEDGYYRRFAAPFRNFIQQYAVLFPLLSLQEKS